MFVHIFFHLPKIFSSQIGNKKFQIRQLSGACGRNAEALWAAEALYCEMMQLKGEPSLVTYGTAPWQDIPGISPQQRGCGPGVFWTKKFGVESFLENIDISYIYIIYIILQVGICMDVGETSHIGESDGVGVVICSNVYYIYNLTVEFYLLTLDHDELEIPPWKT